MGKISVMELAGVLSKRYGLNKKEATNFVGKMFEIIQRSLEQDKIVKIKGLGTFKIIDVDARESVNVNTGERVLIEGHNKITFTPDALMKELVNKPFSQFETVVLNEGVDFDDASVNDAVEAEEPQLETEITKTTDEPSAMPLVDFVDREEEEVPEWVIEPVAAPKEEPATVPAPEPVAASEPEKASEPEPVPVSAHMAEQKPEEGSLEEDDALTEETTVDETTEDKDSAEDDVEEQTIEEEYEEETEGSSSGKKWLIALLALLIGFAAGYIIGNYFPFDKSQTPAKQEVVKTEPKAAPKAKSVTPKQDDSIVVAKPEETPAAVQPDQAKPTESKATPAPAPTAKPAESTATPQAATASKPEAGTEKPVLDQYQQKDARVRTGAWRIVGTAKVVKVKEGETLAKISRSHLGPDMDCYVEVYNNLTASSPLKAGQEIKIPKLEHKKKKQAQTVK